MPKSAVSDTPIGLTVGPVKLDLGRWVRNCSKLESEVVPPKPPQGIKDALPPNTFAVAVSGSTPGAGILFGLVGAAVDAAKQKDAAESLAGTAPGFDGKLIVQVSAEGMKRTCDGTNQAVGWAWYLKVLLRGKASTGVLAGGGELSLSFGPYGESWDPTCDCNKELAALIYSPGGLPAETLLALGSTPQLTDPTIVAGAEQASFEVATVWERPLPTPDDLAAVTGEDVEHTVVDRPRHADKIARGLRTLEEGIREELHGQ